MFGIEVGKQILAMYLGDIPVKGVITQSVDVNYLICLENEMKSAMLVSDVKLAKAF